MIKPLLLTVVVLSTPSFSHAGQEIKEVFSPGEYTLQKKESKGECPQVNISYPSFKDGTSLLMLDPRVVFNLDLLNKEKSEKVPDGCHYNHELKYKNNTLIKTTSRFDCPKVSENGVQKAILEKTSTGLKFKSLLNDEVTTECFYEKGGK